MKKTPEKRKHEPRALTPEQQEMLLFIERDAPSKLNHFKKAFEGYSLRSAIIAKCLECCSCDVKAIRECASTACPLANVRPYQEVRPHRKPEKTNAPRATAGENHDRITG